MSNPIPAWLAGAAEADITPPLASRPFLAGYPHVPRHAEGVHDSLFASALYLSDGETEAIFVACDVLQVPRDVATRARRRIEEAVGVPIGHVMVTATHTHSGPVTTHTLHGDPVVPAPDPAYLAQLEAGIVQAATAAAALRQPARLLHAQADGSSLGTNRRDPAGPRLPRVPVLIARGQQTGEPIAVMVVCNMHPTVLHEDSRLISGDFPGLARRWLKRHAVGPRCPLIYHMGAAGNQSPRHVVRANTLDEARRLGETLGREIQAALDRARSAPEAHLRCVRQLVDLPIRRFPAIEQAQVRLEQVRAHWQRLQQEQAPRAQVRTAECDVFGAERVLALARAAADGRAAEAARHCMPAEVQAVALGEHTFIGWPGEVFIEFALQAVQDHPDVTIITMVNGGLQGYLVTQEAVAEGGYEASNALFASPESGQELVRVTLDVLASMKQAAPSGRSS